MPKLDLRNISEREGSNYPAPFAERAAGRIKQALGVAGGLKDFGVNLTQLPPGAWSSQRHWHSEEDEFVYVISGELTLITNAGEQLLHAGHCAAFPKNTPDGHHMINRSHERAVYLDIGTRSANDVCNYPDIDLHADGNDYTHKDGQPYPR
ncbi:cupin domain-containing protein [Rhodanobacter sp. A1T4]|uniref:cupin domain-containing protein n=1 Tax=Rhodanobacter sp. A1T4 TaxID=2723087 RepID=UPI00161061CB|nr:cupin domain-containing protein [Rhodanobacter sp. A1T4]MBB6247933.1 putative cupin superfamily protein [Rhodanobacter sp. A1T4]